MRVQNNHWIEAKEDKSVICGVNPWSLKGVQMNITHHDVMLYMQHLFYIYEDGKMWWFLK